MIPFFSVKYADAETVVRCTFVFRTAINHRVNEIVEFNGYMQYNHFKNTFSILRVCRASMQIFSIKDSLVIQMLFHHRLNVIVLRYKIAYRY